MARVILLNCNICLFFSMQFKLNLCLFFFFLVADLYHVYRALGTIMLQIFLFQNFLFLVADFLLEIYIMFLVADLNN